MNLTKKKNEPQIEDGKGYQCILSDVMDTIHHAIHATTLIDHFFQVTSERLSEEVTETVTRDIVTVWPMDMSVRNR